ncbi:hypothetical protein ACLB2K_050047 [Fragaria x ananassa]
MVESDEVEDGSRVMKGDQSDLVRDRTPGTIALKEGSSERLECAVVGNDRERTPDGVMRDLTHEEMEDMVERLRADVARMERERTRDRLEAATREKKLERDNATIMDALARRLESDEAIDRATPTLQEPQGEGGRPPMTPPTVTRRTVHVRANLFLESMEIEGPPTIPTPVEEKMLEKTGVEAALIAMRDSVKKSPRGTTLSESPSPFSGSNLPDLDRTQLETSRLLDILTEKSSFPGSFISIPEVQARNKVLKHCGLPDDEYLVLFTPSYRDAKVLVAESYPFYRGNYYMTVVGGGEKEEEEVIKDFASYKDSKVIMAPESWLDLRIKGSQLSQYFRKKSKHKLKGLFSYPAFINGIHHSLHWISEAHHNSWHVLLDATALVIGKDHLNLMLHRPDFVLCSLDNSHGQTSKITCLLVRKKSFDTTMPPPQINE